jgi:hypothetical protein
LIYLKLETKLILSFKKILHSAEHRALPLSVSGKFQSDIGFLRLQLRYTPQIPMKNFNFPRECCAFALRKTPLHAARQSVAMNIYFNCRPSRLSPHKSERNEICALVANDDLIVLSHVVAKTIHTTSRCSLARLFVDLARFSY